MSDLSGTRVAFVDCGQHQFPAVDRNELSGLLRGSNEVAILSNVLRWKRMG